MNSILLFLCFHENCFPLYQKNTDEKYKFYVGKFQKNSRHIFQKTKNTNDENFSEVK